MISDNIMSIGIRLIGIYFLALSLAMAPQISATYAIAYSGDYNHPQILMASIIANISIMFVMGLYLTIKAEKIYLSFFKSTDENKSELNELKMSDMIQLIGVFIAASSFSDLVKVLLEIFIIESTIMLRISTIAPHLISVIIGIIFIFKGSSIAKYLREK